MAGAAATKAQVHWDRNSAATALNLMSGADHLTSLKDNYRRDCQNWLADVERMKQNPTELAKVRKFMDSTPEMSAAKFDEKVKLVEEILETLGGPITEKA